MISKENELLAKTIRKTKIEVFKNPDVKNPIMFKLFNYYIDLGTAYYKEGVRYNLNHESQDENLKSAWNDLYFIWIKLNLNKLYDDNSPLMQLATEIRRVAKLGDYFCFKDEKKNSIKRELLTNLAKITHNIQLQKYLYSLGIKEKVVFNNKKEFEKLTELKNSYEVFNNNKPQFKTDIELVYNDISNAYQQSIENNFVSVTQIIPKIKVKRKIKV